ncbi:hypothetical protein LA080_007190 [Diaporthe eres]|nr:hypothetical protein LA080_007190 [Diaporthe eres]
MQDENDKASKTAHPKLYCDKTRKVDLVWVLQDNSQVQQALELLESLKIIAVSKVNINLLTRCLMLTMSWTFLMVWIFYPEPGFKPQFKDPKKENKVQENESSEEKTWFEHHVTPDEFGHVKRCQSFHSMSFASNRGIGANHTEAAKDMKV